MKKNNQKQLLGAIKKVIEEKVSPSLQMHGGDLEIVELLKTENGWDLKVILKGACEGCGAAPITLQYLVQETIDTEFPDDLIDIVPVFDPEQNLDDYL